MRRTAAAAVALTASLALAGTAAGHDHPGPTLTTDVPAPAMAFNSSPEGAWELLATIPTGNPHTDIDFFTRGVEIFASVGTLAIGPNGGGQTIVQLTRHGEVSASTPQFVSNHPSASCASDPAAALGLQHDVEATPKGKVIFNTNVPGADTRDAQLLLDATDNEGRCHDAPTAGLGNDPQGGIEIIDITDITHPVEIGLISHIGEAHTVNVDPRRAHIAYAVSSDSVGVTCNADRTACTRANENPNASFSTRAALDGFEVIDLRSCMNFPLLTSVVVKRMVCRPEVYRYRYSSAQMALGHTVNGLAGCHELEVYPNDRLACAGINATVLLNMRNAFDDRGTPSNFRDDRLRGTPLPCAVRDSMSPPPFASTRSMGGVAVTDCVVGQNSQDLTVPGWLSIGAPSLAGVGHIGTAFHQGRGGPHPATEEVDVSHEAELTRSGRHLLVTDERGGGVTPPGATCSPGVDNVQGNGGIHAYRIDRLVKTVPAGAQAAWRSYARTRGGDKAIYRAPIMTTPEPTVCTAHVFHQIPGQNRIFMGWYSQGTQVVDFVEYSTGTLEFRRVGHLIPANANTWVSAIFKTRLNADGTYTYWGATGDFNIGTAGRNAIDIYEVTLPAPPQ